MFRTLKDPGASKPSAEVGALPSSAFSKLSSRAPFAGDTEGWWIGSAWRHRAPAGVSGGARESRCLVGHAKIEIVF